MEEQKLGSIAELERGSCHSSRLDLRSLPKAEASLASGRYIRIPVLNPLPTYVQGNTLETIVQSSELEWTSLSESYIKAVVSVIKIDNTGKEVVLVPADLVSYNSMVLYSLFQQCQVAINDVVVSGDTDALYNYSTAMSILAYLNKRTQNTVLASSGLIWSTPGTLTTTDPTVPGCDNEGLVTRHGLAELSGKTL